MAKHSERDCLNQAPRRRWLWPALALPLVAAGLATGAVALAQPRPGHSHGSLDQDNQDHYARLLSEVKADEEQARAEIAEAERADDEDELASRLVRTANSHRLAGEVTRQAYLKAAERISDPMQRSRVLRKLLAAAPITEDTGAGVLRSAMGAGTGRDALRVLMYMHEIKESDLVRDPLAMDYLSAAEKLSAPEDLAEALRGLLHPTELDPEVVVRALGLAERLTSDDDRVKVLREVTDHQELTGEVSAAYRKIVGAMKTASAKSTANGRYDDAADEEDDEDDGDEYGQAVSVSGPAYAFQFNTQDSKELKLRLQEMKEQMKRMKLKLKRDLGRMDGEID